MIAPEPRPKLVRCRNKCGKKHFQRSKAQTRCINEYNMRIARENRERRGGEEIPAGGWRTFKTTNYGTIEITQP